MDSLLIDRLKKTNKKVHHKIVEWFSKSDYQADAYVNEVISQLSRNMSSNKVSDTDLANKLGVNKSAVSQFFDSDGNIKVKTLFKYINAAGLSLKPPVLANFNSEMIYHNFLNEGTIDIPILSLGSKNEERVRGLNNSSTYMLEFTSDVGSNTQTIEFACNMYNEWNKSA